MEGLEIDYFHPHTRLSSVCRVERARACKFSKVCRSWFRRVGGWSASRVQRPRQRSVSVALAALFSSAATKWWQQTSSNLRSWLPCLQKLLTFAQVVWSDSAYLALALCIVLLAWTFTSWVHKNFIKLPVQANVGDSPVTFSTSAELEKAVVDLYPAHRQHIRHNSVVIGDSQLIIRYFETIYDICSMSAATALKRYPQSKKGGLVPYSQLSVSQRAVSDAVRIICEADLYWGGVSTRWLGKAGLSKCEHNWTTTVQLYFDELPFFLRGLLTPMIRIIMANQALGQGLARHSPADQLFLCKRAVSALSSFLGEQAFFLGDFPSECDCMAFGSLEALLDGSWESPLNIFVRSECVNLVYFVRRVRDTYFADFLPLRGHKTPPSLPDTSFVVPSHS